MIDWKVEVRDINCLTRSNCDNYFAFTSQTTFFKFQIIIYFAMLYTSLKMCYCTRQHMLAIAVILFKSQIMLYFVMLYTILKMYYCTGQHMLTSAEITLLQSSKCLDE
jgi:hypothetical protein